MANVELAFAIALWLIVLYRFWRQLFGERGKVSKIVTAMLALDAAAMSSTDNPVSMVVDRWLSPHVLMMMQFFCGMAASALFDELARREYEPTARAWQQLRLTLGFMPLMVVAFVFAPVHRPGRGWWVEFAMPVQTHGWAQFLWIGLFWLAFATPVTWALIRGVRFLRHYMADAPDRRNALTYRVFLGVYVLLLVFIVFGTCTLTLRGAGVAGKVFDAADSLMRDTEIVGLIGILVATISINMRLSHTIGVLPVLFNLFYLRPLWLDMKQAVPTFPIAAGGRRAPMDARLKLYRRVIEIRDGYLSIAGWYSSEHRKIIATVAPETKAADSPLAEAAIWELARRAMLRGDPPLHAEAPLPHAQTLQDDVKQLRRARRSRRRAHAIADMVEARLMISAAPVASPSTAAGTTV